MTDPALIERITRSLAYMLRHQPHEFDLELDAHGYGDVDEVVRALNERLGEPVERPDLEAAIVAGDRPRYEIVGEKVRALYGHSIPVEPGEPGQPPELLYVGLGARDAERALEHGLSGGRRRFLHLARSVDDARESGRRAGREYAVLVVRATEAWEEGVNFYDRQALFLSEAIPTRFIGLHARYQDGEDRHTSERGGWAPRQDDRGPRDDEPRRDSHDDAPRGPRGEFDRGGHRGGDRGRRGRGRGRNRGGDRDREHRPVHAGGDTFRDERRPAVREEPRGVRRDEPRRESFARDDEPRREPEFREPRSEPRREARGEQRDVRRDEPRRDEPRRDEPRRDDFRRDEPRREESRREAPRRDEPRRDEPRRDDRSRERFDRPERHGDRDRGHQRSGGERGFEPRSDRPASHGGGHGGGHEGGRGEVRPFERRRDERPQRDDRPQREDRPQRSERPRPQEAPRPPQPQRAEAAPVRSSSADEGSFGLGIFGEPERKPKATPPPREERRPAPPPPPAPKKEEDSFGGFGAGL